MVIWITGLSGSGKTTIAKKVYKQIKQKYLNTVFLDGDCFRQILGNSIGYSMEERMRGGLIFHKLCKYLDAEGIIVVCSVMLLFKKIQKINRDNFSKYIEIFLDTDMDELIRRDKKLLYSKGQSGEVKNVVGIDLTYDIPDNPELHLKNNFVYQIDENVKKIIEYLNINLNMEI